MNASVVIAGSQLLKHVHVTKLKIIVFVDMIMQSQQKNGSDQNNY